jgi:diguanylate cyclase (GGDEF)-like protein/PAS domain S-box-containing protein
MVKRVDREKTGLGGALDKDFFRMFADLSYDWESWQTLDGRYVYVTPACRRMTGYGPEEFYGDPRLMEKIIHAKSLRAWKSHRHSRLRTHESETMDLQIVTKHGVEKWIRHVCQVFDDESISVPGIRSCNIDITVRKQTEAELAIAAMFDPLTGLMNRRFLSENLKHEINRCLRSKNPFSIVLGDLDHFKAINDQYGHDCGDELLKHVTRLLDNSVRAQDMVSRWGGEEFLILLPDTLIGGARHLAEKLRRKIDRNKFVYDGQDIRATMSFGASQCDCYETPDSCIRTADANMYEAKKRGRNTVV